MKCIILCAGYATRLYPLTKDTPKPLLEIAGKPMLNYIIERLEKLDVINEIIIVTNNKFFEHFNKWKETINDDRIVVVNDQTMSNEDRLGAIGDIHYAVQERNIDDDVLIVAGDNLFEFDLEHLYLFFSEKKASVVALYDVGEKTVAANKLGVVEIDTTSKIIDFEEKPAEPKTTLTSTACYILTKNDIRLLEKCIQEKNKPDNLGEFIKYLSQKESVYGYVFLERWFDIGTHDQLERAHEELSDQTKQ